MRTSLIINTNYYADGGNLYRAAPYVAREKLLADTLSRVDIFGFDEVIVAGVFNPELGNKFQSVRFVSVPPTVENRWDALMQREVGARFASGDILVFCHDDHSPANSLDGIPFAATLKTLGEEWDILVPKRKHKQTGEELTNGRLEGYMGGHCYAMRRAAWATVPLTNAPNEFWDTFLTQVWLNLGFKIVWTDKLVHVDLEAVAGEA